jgi:hypothetical protein
MWWPDLSLFYIGWTLDHILQNNTIKRFLAIFWRLTFFGHILTRLYSDKSRTVPLTKWDWNWHPWESHHPTLTTRHRSWLAIETCKIGKKKNWRLCSNIDTTWNDAAKEAQGHVTWRIVTDDLCFSQNYRPLFSVCACTLQSVHN